MVVLWQDYKNWRLARRDLKTAQTEAGAKYNSMIKDVDLDEYLLNLRLMEEFVRQVPTDETQPDYAERFVAAYEKLSRVYKATTCFLRLDDKINRGTLFEQKLQIKEVRCCINVKKDGTFDENLCQGCPHFDEMNQYSALMGRVTRMQEKTDDAKRQFLSHFWKQKTKGC